jgi:hypothetical protein
MSVREENLNVELASLLVERGLGATAEVKLHIGKQRKLPDVLMVVDGVNVILEGKYDSSSARQNLRDQCRQRIDKGLAEVAAGIVYDASQISSGVLVVDQGQIRERLKKMPLVVRIWRLGQENEPETSDDIGWNTLTLDDLASSIRDAANNVASEDILAKAVEKIESCVDRMALSLLRL